MGAGGPVEQIGSERFLVGLLKSWGQCDGLLPYASRYNYLDNLIRGVLIAETPTCTGFAGGY